MVTVGKHGLGRTGVGCDRGGLDVVVTLGGRRRCGSGRRLLGFGGRDSRGVGRRCWLGYGGRRRLVDGLDRLVGILRLDLGRRLLDSDRLRGGRLLDRLLLVGLLVAGEPVALGAPAQAISLGLDDRRGVTLHAHAHLVAQLEQLGVGHTELLGQFMDAILLRHRVVQPFVDRRSFVTPPDSVPG